MNISTISLRDLEYIVAVAEFGHFGRAAGSCHVSQPALSGQIRKVEEFLEVKLFERDNRNVRLTAMGEVIIPQARVVLAEARKIAELARRGREPLSGTLRLGVIASLGPYLMPHLLAPLRRAFPKLELLLKEGLTDGLIAELRSGELDAVLASPTFAAEGLREIPLFFEPFLLAAPKGHPILSKPPRPADLRSDEMVLLEDGHCLKDQALGICPSSRRGQERRFHATSMETLRHLVASGQGYTLFPVLAAEESGKLRGLVQYRSFADKSVGRTIALYARQRYAPMSDLDLLSGKIRAALPPEVRMEVKRESSK